MNQSARHDSTALEHPGLKVYQFYDGDFTFWQVHCDGPNKATFRVRLDQTPATRYEENKHNANANVDGAHATHHACPVTLSPASKQEVEAWLCRFKDYFPQRDPGHTRLLRLLKLRGPTKVDPDDEWDLAVAAFQLRAGALVVRDFEPKVVPLVQAKDGVWSLTEHGEWLTSLMK